MSPSTATADYLYVQENPLLQGVVTSVFRAWHLLSNDPWAQLELFLNLLYHLPTEGACPGKSLKPSDPMFSPIPSWPICTLCTWSCVTWRHLHSCGQNPHDGYFSR